MRDKLILLLASGSTREEALRITGASDDLLTEYMNDPSFLSDIKEKRDANRQELIEQGYAKLEQATLSKISGQLEYADIPALCRVLETAAKNRVLHRNPAGHFTNPTTHLTIELKVPQGASAEKVILDEKTNQIVAIGDRNMAAMPLTGVTRLFKELDKANSVRDTIDTDIQDVVGEKNDHIRTVQQAQGAAQDETIPSRRVA